MKSRTMFVVLLMLLSLALGSAVAKEPANNSSNSYLALGDSVTFGYINSAGYEYYYPQNFVSFSDYDSLTFGLNLVNASCPGETTGSFLSPLAPDNGCRAYRAAFPLHVTYQSIVNSTQYVFATGFLRTNLSTQLVTIMLGANDLLLLEQQCNGNPQCIEAGLPAVYATAEANMTEILTGLRATGYSGTIVIVNYYSPDYTNQLDTQAIEGLNQAISAPAQQFGALVADVFTAFQNAANSQFAMGDTCAAGLLVPANPQTSPPTCDIHASQLGHKLIASVIANLPQSPQGKSSK
jgi:lysophospholipase L1-like esterase